MNTPRPAALGLAFLVASVGCANRGPHPTESVASSQPPPLASAPALAPPAPTASCDAEPGSEFQRGAELVNPYLVITDRAASKSPRRADDLRAGIACLDRDITAYPSHWQAFWVRGKAYQALRDHTLARESLAAAYKLETSNSNVGRELMFELLALGLFADGAKVAVEVAQRAPQDAGLRANLALALVLAGDLPGAQEAITTALRLDPDDTISQALERRIGEIARGERPRPRSFQDLER